MKEESWEREDDMRSKYPGLFLKSGKKFNFEDEIFILGGKKCNSRVNSCIFFYLQKKKKGGNIFIYILEWKLLSNNVNVDKDLN